MELGLYLGSEGSIAPAYPLDKITVGLFVVGFGLKLALVPFYFWLPGLAEHAKPMTTALVVSIVDIAAFSELAHLRLSMPWIFYRLRCPLAGAGPAVDVWRGTVSPFPTQSQTDAGLFHH